MSKTPRGKNVDRVIALDKRRRQAVALRQQGASIADIARTLDVAESTIKNDLSAALNSVRDSFDTRELFLLEMQRLDRLQMAVYNDALKGDDKKIATVIKLMERRARLAGLDAEPDRDTSTQVHISVNPQLFPPAVQQRLAAQQQQQRQPETIAGEEAADDDSDD